MTNEQRDNSGAIFTNTRKEKDAHPDWTGSAMIDGREYWVSGWTKQGRNGEFYSLAFKPKDAQHQKPAPAPQRRPPPTTSRLPIKRDMDDDIPFLPEFR